jgi:hypothetical protein
MTAHKVSDEAVSPFDVLVGTWVGGVSVFSLEGKPIAYWPSQVKIHWVTKDGARHLRYQQHIEPLAEFMAEVNASAKSGATSQADDLATKYAQHLQRTAGPTLIDVDLTVTGARLAGTSQNGSYTVTGGASAPGHFLFMIRHAPTGVVFCNNQYFVNANLRQIVGPTLGQAAIGGDHAAAVPYTQNVQTFTRISDAVEEPLPKQESKPSKSEMAQVYAKAWKDDEFRRLLESDPNKALREFAKENNLPWGRLMNVEPGLKTASAEEIRSLSDSDGPCPPPACC